MNRDESGDPDHAARDMSRALRNSEIDSVISHKGVALIRRGEIAADWAKAVHEERIRLSGILHDHLQQLLVASQMHIGVALKGGGADAARAATLRAGELIKEAIEASRNLALELDPPALAESGLRGGLEWLAGWMGQVHGLVVEHHIAEDAEPEEESLRLLLFHGCRELLLNVVKHAGTSSASLSLRREGDELVLTVADRGRGTDLRDATRVEGIGLARIRRAVEAIQGSVVVRSSPGAGMTIEVRVPVRTAPVEA